MFKFISSFLICISVILSNYLIAHEWDSSRIDAHAPIGVMADHVHKKNEVMFSYRLKKMTMEGNYSGSDKISTQDVLVNHMMSPIKMTAKMHILGAMYAPSDKVTLSLMVPVIEKKMVIEARNGNQFRTQTNGLGDIKVAALIPTPNFAHGRTQLNLGVSIPTGSIQQKVNTPMGLAHAPYGMQLGSGSYHILPSANWIRQNKNHSIGVQVSASLPVSKNKNDYQVGDMYQLTSWGSKIITPNLSLSSRLTAQVKDNIEGIDSDINNPVMAKMMSPAFNEALRGGKILEASLGANYRVKRLGRVAIEFSKPIYQKLDGPQLGKKTSVTIGLQRSFN